MNSWQKIQEGKLLLTVPKEEKISAGMPIFFNPIMSINRDISVLLLSALGKKEMKIADILSGTGVRALRFLKELDKNIVEEVYANDANPLFKETIKKNAEDNKVSLARCKISINDANKFMEENAGFDYIDIDPFGTPCPFLDTACRHIAREGILALTATDTAALSGTSIEACKRKYWAVPLRNELMHETGIRILIRKAQLVASQYDKALTPIYCHSTEHYMRVFLKVEKSKEAVKDVIKQHQFLHFYKTGEFLFSKENTLKDVQSAGPLWIDQLWDKELAKKIALLSQEKECGKETKVLVEKIAKEAEIGTPYFYDLHEITSRMKSRVPSDKVFFHALKTPAVKTHFRETAVRTDATFDEVKNALKKAVK